MTEKFYIDGKDAHSVFGIFITKGSYDELLSFPPLKDPDSNDWPEEDGKEVDLSTPILNTQDVMLKFAGNRTMCAERFIEILSDRAYHTFDFRSIGRTYKLRLISQENLNLASCLETFSLKFANDFPVSSDYVYATPSSGIVSQRGYEIDGRSFADYGVFILKGSDVEIRKTPVVKTNLLRNINTLHGAEYDDKIVRFQSKEVKLKCLMRAKSLGEFWRNYDAFLFDLTRPKERALYAGGYTHPCYYKGCSTVNFLHTGCVWFEFNLTLVFTLSNKVHEAQS